MPEWKSDPGNRNIAEYTAATRTAEWLSGLKILQVHDFDQCGGEHCPIHNPRPHDLDHLEMRFINGSLVRVKDDGSLVPDPDDYNFNQGKNILLRNSAHCAVCDTEIVSEFTHDFVVCKCGLENDGIFVDGGLSYLRRGGKLSNLIETSVSFQKMLD